MHININTVQLDKVWRLGFFLCALSALFALSYSDTSRATSNARAGFLYSDHLKHPSAVSYGAFSVNNKDDFWQAPISRAQHAVNAMPLTDYLANQFVNDGESAASRAHEHLTHAGWQLGADIIQHAAARRVRDTGSFQNRLRHLDIDIKTKTGRGFTYAGIDTVLALRESADDAFAVQMRGYSGFEDSRFGFNLGGIYRRAVGETSLFGLNTFADYETFDGHPFIRWSGGAEIRSQMFDFYANIYQPITDAENDLANNRRLYTAAGYDAEIHVRAPQDKTFTGIFGIYQWTGEYGDDDEFGLLTGFRVTPAFVPLLLELEYRSGDGNTFGGRLAYSHEFGDNRDHKRIRHATFQPRHYFFVPAEREHSQRIFITAPELASTYRVSGLFGFARVRGVGTELATDVRVRGLDGGVNVIASGNSRSVLGGVTLTVNQQQNLPWALPPNTESYIIDTETNSGLTLEWLAGSGRSVVLYNNTGVNVSETRIQVIGGRADVAGESGFRVLTPNNNVNVLLRGRGDVSVRAESNQIVAMGEFRLQTRNGVYSNSGAAVGISLTYDFNGMTSEWERVGRGSGEIRVEESGVTVVAGRLVNAYVLPAASPIRLPVGYSGVVATVVGVGGLPLRSDYVYSAVTAAATARELAVNTNSGVVFASNPLPAGSYNLTVEVVRGGRTESKATVVVSVIVAATVVTPDPGPDPGPGPGPGPGPDPVPALTFSSLGGLSGAGTSNSPFMVLNGHTGMIATLSVANGVNNVSYSFAASVSGSLTLNTVGVVSATESLTTATTASIIVVALADSSPALTATLYVQVLSPDIQLRVSPAQGLPGMGTSNSPITVSVGHNAVIASVGVLNPADSVAYTFAASSEDSLTVNVSGVVSAEGVLTDVQTREIEVVALADLTAALTTTVHVQVFSPLLATISVNNAGEGTDNSPIELRAGFDGVIGTVVLSNTVVGADYTYATAAGGTLTVGAGGVFGSSEALTDGDYTLPITVSEDGTSVLELTVHITVFSFNLSISPMAGVTGEGTQTSPYVLRVSDLPKGATLLDITPGNGFNDNYQYSVEGTVFGFTDGAGNLNVLEVNAVGLLEESLYTITMSVETEDTAGGVMESIVSTLYFSTQNIPIPTIGYTPVPEISRATNSGHGTEESPFIVQTDLRQGSRPEATIIDFTGGFRHGGTIGLTMQTPDPRWEIAPNSARTGYAFSANRDISGGRSSVVVMVGQSERSLPLTVWFEAFAVTASLITTLPRDNDGNLLTPDPGGGQVLGKIDGAGGKLPLSGYTYSLVSGTNFVLVNGDSLLLATSPAFSQGNANAVAVLSVSDGTNTANFTLTVVLNTNPEFMLAATSTKFNGIGTEDFPFVVAHVSDLEVGVTLAMLASRGSPNSAIDVYSGGSSDFNLQAVGSTRNLVVLQKLVAGMSYQIPVTVVNGTMTVTDIVHVEVLPSNRLGRPPAINPVVALFTGTVEPGQGGFHARCTANNANYCVLNSNTRRSNTSLIQFSAQRSGAGSPTYTLSGPDAGSFKLTPSGTTRTNLKVGGSNLAADRVYQLTLTITDSAGYNSSRSFRLVTAP